MGEMSLNVGVISIPESRLKNFVRWLPRWLVGMQRIETRLSDIEKHIGALTEITHILVADISDKWSPEKRERVQKRMADFTVVNDGLGRVATKGNPLTQQELDTLRAYTRQAQRGSTFTPEQATEFRNLSERASQEYPNQDWIKDLLKIALFVFAVYAIAQLLKSD